MGRSLLVLLSCALLIGDGSGFLRSRNSIFHAPRVLKLDEADQSRTTSRTSPTTSTPSLSTSSGPEVCPAEYPYVYKAGSYCCRYQEEKSKSRFDRACTGGKLTFDSKCCKEDEFIPCRKRPCQDNLVTSSGSSTTAAADQTRDHPTTLWKSDLWLKHIFVTDSWWDNTWWDDWYSWDDSEDESEDEHESGWDDDWDDDWYSWDDDWDLWDDDWDSWDDDWSTWHNDWNSWDVIHDDMYWTIPPLPPTATPPLREYNYQQELIDLVCLFLENFGDICGTWASWNHNFQDDINMQPPLYGKRDTEEVKKLLEETKKHRPLPPPEVMKKMKIVAAIRKHQQEMKERQESGMVEGDTDKKKRKKRETREKRDTAEDREKRDMAEEDRVGGEKKKRDAIVKMKKRAAMKGLNKWLRSRLERRAAGQEPETQV